MIRVEPGRTRRQGGHLGYRSGLVAKKNLVTKIR